MEVIKRKRLRYIRANAQKKERRRRRRRRRKKKKKDYRERERERELTYHGERRRAAETHRAMAMEKQEAFSIDYCLDGFLLQITSARDKSLQNVDLFAFYTRIHCIERTAYSVCVHIAYRTSRITYRV